MKFTYEPLTQKQIEDVHEAALQVLEKCGFEFKDSKALELLAKNGCEISGEVAKIPRKLVAECLKVNPKSFSLAALDNSYSFPVGPVGKGDAVYANMHSSSYFADVNGVRRPTSREDFRKMIKLCDTSDVIQFVNELVCCPVDTEWATMRITNLEDLFTLTRMPLILTIPHVGLKATEEMMNVIGGSLTDHSMGAHAIEGIGVQDPLIMPKETIDVIFENAESKFNLPLMTITCAMGGTTAPVKPLEEVVTVYASMLAENTFSQLVNTGCPYLFMNVSMASNFQTLGAINCTPDCLKMSAMLNQLAHHAGIIFFESGGRNDAPYFDHQAVLETVLNHVVCGFSNVDGFTSCYGAISTQDALCFEKFILDEEITRLRKQLTAPIEDLRDNAVDIITEVGCGGNYLKTKDTMKSYRKPCYRSKIFPAQSFENLVEKEYSLNDILTQEWEKRVASYKAPELTLEQKQKLAEIKEKYIKIYDEAIRG